MNNNNINMVIDAIHKKKRELIINHKDRGYSPNLAVYMDIDFYYELKKCIYGKMDATVFGFYQEDKILGYPIWQVLPGRGAGEPKISHPPFRIVSLDD